MAPASTVASILGLSVVSGVNLYLAVFVVGLAARFHWVAGLPPELQALGHPVVLTVAGLFYAIEFFADKIPFVTVAWDGIHTFIRPLGGALLALRSAGQLDPTLQILAMLAGGSIALGSHGTKMGIRMLAHTAPEPGTHSLISLAEDLGVVGLLALVYTHPYVAIPILLAIILVIALLVPMLARPLHFLLVGLAGRIMSWVKRAGRSDVPRWAEVAILELDSAGSEQVIRAFARKTKGAPRWKEGYLVRLGERWGFLYKGLFKAKTLWMDEGRLEPARIDRGSIWDSVIFMQKGKAQIFFLSKDWAHAFPDAKNSRPTSLAKTAEITH